MNVEGIQFRKYKFQGYLRNIAAVQTTINISDTMTCALQCRRTAQCAIFIYNSITLSCSIYYALSATGFANNFRDKINIDLYFRVRLYNIQSTMQSVYENFEYKEFYYRYIVSVLNLDILTFYFHKTNYRD